MTHGEPKTVAAPGKASSVERVRQALAKTGIRAEIRVFDQTTRTAEDAAAAIGCEVGQIVKSLVFRKRDSGQGLLVLVSGKNRADENLIAKALGEPIRKADADFVRSVTGFAIGGVAPLGHLAPLDVLIDEDLAQYAELWAAAGSPNSVFRLSPDQLQSASGGRLVRVH